MIFFLGLSYTLNLLGLLNINIIDPETNCSQEVNHVPHIRRIRNKPRPDHDEKVGK